ncbi:MAG: 1-acyl-sn-glycerol-3-phosphate acyltransferase [Chloroflexi bacterium]|nr:1-acyl-sn-glycerol-3-phosphate acyltransferase [Chloroflexota bacterium]
MIFHRLFKIFLRLVLSIILDIKIEGLEKIPLRGSLILAHNHMNWVDAVLATSLVPRDIVSMTKLENLDLPVIGGLMRLYGSFPIRRGEVDRRALAQSISALKQGLALLMVPEGTRGKDWRLKPGKDGLAYVALRTGSPVVLMAISGSEQFWSNLTRLRRTPTQVIVDEPFYLSAAEGEVDREVLREITKEVMYRLASLLPAEYRGVYSDLSQAPNRYIMPTKQRILIPVQQGGDA